jgi:hypothetical protein
MVYLKQYDDSIRVNIFKLPSSRTNIKVKKRKDILLLAWGKKYLYSEIL